MKLNSKQPVCVCACAVVLMLQEAGYCCRGTDGCNAVMRLPGPVQDDVWVAVNRGDAAAVRQHMTPLRLSPSPVRGRPAQLGAAIAGQQPQSLDDVDRLKGLNLASWLC